MGDTVLMHGVTITPFSTSVPTPCMVFVTVVAFIISKQVQALGRSIEDARNRYLVVTTQVSVFMTACILVSSISSMDVKVIIEDHIGQR